MNNFLKAEIIKAIVESLKKIGIDQQIAISIEYPAQEKHGDYSTNIALSCWKNIKTNTYSEKGNFCLSSLKTPQELALLIVKNFNLPSFIGKIEIAGGGFINFWLNEEYLIASVPEIISQNYNYGKNELFAGKKILIEHTSPNPQTTIMLGHLRNNFLGMAVSNILTFEGAKVIKDCIINDRGIHICRSMWGYLAMAEKESNFEKEELLGYKGISDEKIRTIASSFNWKEKIKKWSKQKNLWYLPLELKLKPDHANLIWYVLGSRAYKLLPEVKLQVEEILKDWEKEEGEVRELWKQILFWSSEGYAQTYRRIGSIHDFVWKESDHWKQGVKLVEEGRKKGVFVKSEGALVTNLAKVNLPDTVAIKADGTALYFTQDLALTKNKIEKFPSDLYIWTIGLEQSSYFKQLFAVIEQMGIAKKEKLFHLAHALINFKGGGKMATRKGEVITADNILDMLLQRTIEIIKNTRQDLRGEIKDSEISLLVEKIAVAALKYSLLKYSRGTTMFFEINESLALDGDSGPYLLYTYARCRSVREKAQSVLGDETHRKLTNTQNTLLLKNLIEIDFDLMRLMVKFPEVVAEAGKLFAPNLIAKYLFELAQKYNLFYNKAPIIKASDQQVQKFRVMINGAVGIILKNGLGLLGINPAQKM